MIRQTASGLWVIDGDSHISAWIEAKGQLQHDFQTFPLILPLIKAGDTVVDAGANIGDSTGPFLERVGPAGKVFAFEPNPDAFACLVKNCPDASCYQVALSHEAVAYPFQRCENEGASHITNNSTETVQAITLDSFKLDKLDFLKIDVEGFELHVLGGAHQTIKDCRPTMLIEINEGALRRQHVTQLDISLWLQAHKYQWWPVVGANLEQELPQYDVIAKPNRYMGSTKKL